MKIKQYDRVLLKDGKAFIADIDRNGDTDTDEIRIEDIVKVL